MPEEAPGCVRKSRRDAAGNSADGDIGPEPLQDIGQKVQVGIGPESQEIGRPMRVFRLHWSAVQDLQLMELEAGEGEGAEHAGLLQEHLAGLSRQADDYMSADWNAPRGRLPDGVLRAGERVGPVHAGEGLIEDGLYAVFDYYNGATGLETGQIR